MHGYRYRSVQGHGFNFGVVANTLDLMVPEAIRKKLEPMWVCVFGHKCTCSHVCSTSGGVG